MKKGQRYLAGGLRALILAVGLCGASLAQVQVVNMVPTSNSGEIARDSEPNVAVDPKNPLSVAASAFTPDPNGTLTGVLYFSTDGGQTWNLTPAFVPGSAVSGCNTCCASTFCDVSLRFGGSSSLLYLGALTVDNNNNVNLDIGQITNIATNARNYTSLVTRSGVSNTNIHDQPWVEATTVLEFAGQGNDHAYVGNNDTNQANRTATVDTSLNPVPPAPAGFTGGVVEGVNTCGRDAPSIRPAIHLAGTVYAAFYRWTANCGNAVKTADVVVVRDDNWATGPNPFQALHDSGNNSIGQRVITGVPIPYLQNLGNQRVGSSIAIAVDPNLGPNNSQTVYVAWGDGNTGATYTLHVRHSTDSGQTWDNNDLRTINNATNPGLAINSHGKVAFLYQQSVNGRWQTIVERTTNAFGNHQDSTLANVPDQKGPNYNGSNPIGDYANMIAIGKDFYGIFSAFNTADNNNFPSGLVPYARYADFGQHKLFADAGHMMPVQDSIDPFFFHITEVAPDKDFYVRDWTNSGTDHDNGQEPSTNTYFWNTSDVWNRATNSAGMPNGNDQYATDPMQAGMGASGDNFAFVRVHRNATGSTAAVTAHFLVSPFGTGSNFQDAGMGADPPLNFGVNDSELTLASGYLWHQDPTASTHACIAVEITGPNDGFIPPGLVNTAPGWPAGVAIVEDNNKAQRNLDVSNNMADNGMADYALIHNAATFTRDMVLRYEAPKGAQVRDARIEMVGGETRAFRSGDAVVLKNMRPGENRWLGLRMTQPKGEPVPVTFYELDKGREVNGFTIVARPVSLPEAIRGNLTDHAHVFRRLAASFKVEVGDSGGDAADALLKRERISPAEYLGFLKEHSQAMNAAVAAAMKNQQAADVFGVQKTQEALLRAIGDGKVAEALSNHSILLHQLDAFTTMLQKAGGDPADIGQMVRWQEELYRTQARLQRLECARYVVEESRAFLRRYAGRAAGADAYSELMRKLGPCFRKTAETLEKGHGELERAADEIQRRLQSPAGLEKAHREFLLKLQDIAR